MSVGTLIEFYFKLIICITITEEPYNLLKLLLPIGIDSDDLDQVWLANMNNFGEERSQIAHSSAIKTKKTPNPADELERVKQIIQELEKVDQLITKLLE